MNLGVKEPVSQNTAGSLFLTAASTNENNTFDSIKNSKAKMLFIKLAQQQLQTTLNSDSIQPAKNLTMDQRIIQAQKQLRVLQAQINLNSPRSTQAIHKLRLMPDAFKVRNEQEIEKFYRHNMERMQLQNSVEKSDGYYNEQFDNDSDQETEKYPNNSKKRFYKHLKEIIGRYERAVAERQLILKEQNENLRSTVYESGFQFKKVKKRNPLETINFEYKLQQLNLKKQKQLEILDRQTSTIFEREFKYRQWQQRDELKGSESQQLFETFHKKKIQQIKKINDKRQKRFEQAFEKKNQLEARNQEKLQNGLQKRDEKFETFCSSRFEDFSEQNKEKFRQKLDVIHRNQALTQQKEDFRLHVLKMKQDERDRQGQQLQQELMIEKKKELKIKNDQKLQKIQKAECIENERLHTKINSYAEKLENVNLRLSLKETEFKKLLEKQRKKQKEERDKYERRVGKLEELMDKQHIELNHKDDKRVEQIRRSIELRDLESMRKGDMLLQRFENNADNQNEKWMEKQKRNDLIMQRHKKVKENAIKLQQERNMLQEISMKNTLKLNTIKESLDYNLQLMKNDPIELLYLKYKHLNLSEEVLEKFIDSQNDEEELPPEENIKAEKEKPKQTHISNKAEIKFTLNQETLKKLETKLQDEQYNTTSMFRSIK